MPENSSMQTGPALHGAEDPAMLSLIRRRLLVDLANLRDNNAIDWFWGKWHDHVMSETAEDLLELRDELQTIWRRSEVTVYPTIGLKVGGPIKAVYRWGASEYFMPLSDGEILDRWLAWRPSVERLKAWQREGWISPKFRKTYKYLPFRCSIRTKRLLPQNGALRAMLIQGVFEHEDHFKYCTNPNCIAPYFIAKRKDQTVCDAEICKAEKQRQHALKWWREKRAKKSPQRAVSKMTKKENKGNVTRKAR